MSALARLSSLSSVARAVPCMRVSVSARTLSSGASYSLPPLPYDYGALEPAISGQIMETHHKKHHQAYVTNLNAAVAQLDEARHKQDPPTKLVQLQSAINFNGGGHINHSIFWTNLAPAQQGGGHTHIHSHTHTHTHTRATHVGAQLGCFTVRTCSLQAIRLCVLTAAYSTLHPRSARLSLRVRWCCAGSPPTGSLLSAIESDFGSVSSLQSALSAACVGVQGSGWGWLGYNATTGRLQLATKPNQDALLELVPLLGIDVWEHAYYYSYGPARAEYLKNIW